MDQAATTPLKKTSLNARHRASGAKMVAFGGWDMPLEYAGIKDEHLAVRQTAGLFDVSHMGELELAGKDALAALQTVCSNDASKLQPGQAQYSALLTEQGTFVDDLVVYRLKNDHFLLVVNASNILKDYTCIADRIAADFAGKDAVVFDATSRYALLSVQGPASPKIIQPLTGVDLASMAYYSFAHGEFANVRGTISRTGYTGEDGFEIFVPPQQADRVWQSLLESGQPDGLIPCGLGARDTLRLEAGMRLYGNDIDETTTALEAGLGWIVGWSKEHFVGAAALRAQKASGVARKLAGFELIDPGVARQGCDVYVGGSAAPAGRVTSGTLTPTVKKSIGMAYLPIANAADGSEFEIDIRGRRTRARVVPMPFYKRTTNRVANSE